MYVCMYVCNRTTCPSIDQGRNNYTFYSTGETYKIKSHITCNTFNVIYMIQCRLCNLQYIGETKRRVKHRLMNIDTLYLTPPVVTSVVSEHFLSNSHCISHILLIRIETLRNERDFLRKASKAHLKKPKPPK